MATMIPEVLEERHDLAVREGAQQLSTLAEYRDAILNAQRGLNARALYIGKLLTEVENLLSHNKLGGLSLWVERELEWDRRTAYSYRQLWKEFGHRLEAAEFERLAIPLTGWQELARESTPEPVRQKLIDKADAGAQLSLKYIRQEIRQARSHAAQTEPLTPRAAATATLPETLCLFCRKRNVTIFPLPNSRQGICGDCAEDAYAFTHQK